MPGNPSARAADVIKPLILALRRDIPMELRSAAASGEYLEGVLFRPTLQRCYAILSEALGPPAKEFSQAAVFEPSIQMIIHALGGIQFEQCLFLTPFPAEHCFVYAALWPWASDASRVTLKVGIYERKSS